MQSLTRQFALVLTLLLGSASVAGQDLKILTTGAFKQVVLEFVSRYEAGSASKVEVLNDTAGALLKRITAGEHFDVVFLTPGALSELSKQGLVDPTSVRPMARVAIGVAVKVGAAQPPMSTVEQFKAAVLAADKVAYIDPASGGSSGLYLDGLFQRLGLAEAVRAKAVLVPGGLVAERVAKGEADLAIHQISEILPVTGVSLVGPLPDAIQNYTTYAYALSKTTRQAAAAATFLALLGSSDAGTVLRAKGMMPVGP